MARRVIVMLVFLLAFVQGTMLGQECGPDWVSGTGTAAPYWLEVDGEPRSNHTNMVTALRALKDTLSARPEATVYVRASFRGRWLGDCTPPTGVDTVRDTLYVELPPETVTVEACPTGWTCTPPDTTPPPDTTAATPPPLPSNLSIAGYTTLDENGIEVEWAPEAGVDSVRIFGGRNDGPSDNWTVMLDPATTVFRRHLGYDSVTGLYACRQNVLDGVRSEPLCRGMDWPPMPFYRVVVDGGLRPVVGDSIRLAMQHAYAGWQDSTIAFPDSVVFVVNGDRHRERGHPYNYPGDTDTFVVPPLDSIHVEWEVFGELPKAGTTIIQTEPAPVGELPTDQTFEEAARYWAENQFSDPTGTRLYYVGDSAGPGAQPQYALGNDRGIIWHYRMSFAVEEGALDRTCYEKGVVVAEYPPVDDTAEPKDPWCES